jgi:uncharacterized membrane protein YkvI
MIDNPSRFIRVIVIPSAVFQSVVFGGAYGTGREIAEFVSVHGPQGGLLALGVIAFGFGLILAISFELARLGRMYDYRRFMKKLIGPAWFSYEILFLVALLLVLAVNGSAAGNILFDRFGTPEWLGVGLLFAVVVVLNYLGRSLLQKSMTFCMVALLIVLLVFCVQTFLKYNDAIALAFNTPSSMGNWLVSGTQYTFYNIALVPVLLYCARGIDTRGEAMVGGFVAGFMGALPALLFHLAFMANYPDVLDQALPTYWMIGQLASPWLMVTYIIVLFAMIIQTIAGLLQGLNERLDAWQLEKSGHPCQPTTHAIVAASVLLVSFSLASFGITALVAKGYGNLAWAYLVVYILPLLTVGVFRIFKDSDSTTG